MVEHGGATWFPIMVTAQKVWSDSFSGRGDPKSEDRPTYLASDIPYLWNKLVEREVRSGHLCVGCRPPSLPMFRAFKLLPEP